MADREGKGAAARAEDTLELEPTSDAVRETPAATSEGRVAQLEARVEELTRALASMDDRLRGLESGRAAETVEAPLVSSVRAKTVPASQDGTVLPLRPAAATPSLEEAEEEEEESALDAEGPPWTARVGELLPQAAALGGRLLLILGGGYLLRALTERGTLPQVVGVSVALAYAAVWLGLAHRRAREEPSLSASVNGVAFALIAFPLLAEVTARFHLLGPIASASALGVAAAAGTFVAWHRRLRLLAWVVQGATIFAIAGTVFQTKTPIPYLLVVIALGVALDWVTSVRKWLPLRVVAAGIADLTLLTHAAVVLVQREVVLETTFILLSLFAAYMVSYMLRARREKRALTHFERLQATAVLVVGYLGAVFVARTLPGTLTLTLGIASLVAGSVGYAVAYFLFVVPAKNRIEAWFNTSYALVGVLVGSWLLLPEPGFAWAGIGVVLAVLGVRDEHSALPLHAAVCAFFAALGSGLLSQVAHAFWVGAQSEWPGLHVPALAALALASIAYLAPANSPAARELLPARAGKLIALAVAVAGIGALLLAVLIDPIAGGVGRPDSDAGSVAALRTGVVAASALVLAALSRLDRFREAGHLVFPVLGFGALKLVAEDFPNGRALTLFAGFVLFGIALLFAPRLRWRPGS